MSSTASPEPVQAHAPSGRWRRLLGNLGLSLASLLIFVGMVELALRWMGYGNVEIYEADPVVYWRLKPNQDCFTKVDHKPVHINAQGTRGQDFQLPKPQGTVRILSLGDSRTFGWGLGEQETYSAQLQDALQKLLGPSRKVEVINAGVNAWSFPQMSAYFRNYALKLQPDYVLVGDANLWTQFSEENSPEFVRQFMRRVRLKNFLRHFALYHYVVEVKLNDFYQRYRVKFIPVDPTQDTLFKQQQQRDPGAVFHKSLHQLCSVALSNRITPVLVYFPTKDQEQRPIQKSLRDTKSKLSQELKVPFVDLTPDLTGPGKDFYLDADPVHFNVEGNRIISQSVLRALTNLVPR